jgi:hypothetical protein
MAILLTIIICGYIVALVCTILWRVFFVRAIFEWFLYNSNEPPSNDKESAAESLYGALDDAFGKHGAFGKKPRKQKPRDPYRNCKQWYDE